MRQWPVQDAKARFSELLDTCLADGPQMVTRRGVEAAVLVPGEEWRRRQGGGMNFKEWLLAEEPRLELEMPRRGRLRRRPPIELE
jgi:prevent-host-death family protein